MRHVRGVCAFLVALGVAGCELTAPRSLDLCGTWLMQNGDSWDTLRSEVSTADLTPVVTLAKPSGTDIITVTAEELIAMAGTPALGCTAANPADPTRLVHGSFTAVPNGSVVTVRAGGSRSSATSAGFDLQVPDGAVDLIAYTSPPAAPTSSFMLPDRMIIRRATSYADGSTIPVFDFAAPEAFSLESASLAGDVHNSVLGETTQFFSGATQLDMRRNTTLSTTVVGLPEARLKEGEYHLLSVRGGGGVSSKTFYRKVKATVVPVPGAAASGITTAIAIVPCTRLRVTIPVQPDYPSFAVATITWTGAGAGRVTVGITKAAAPSSVFWTVEVPAMSPSCAIPANVAYNTSAVVGRGRLGVFRGLIGADGEQLITSPSPIVRP